MYEPRIKPVAFASFRNNTLTVDFKHMSDIVVEYQNTYRRIESLTKRLDTQVDLNVSVLDRLEILEQRLKEVEMNKSPRWGWFPFIKLTFRD